MTSAIVLGLVIGAGVVIGLACVLVALWGWR
jgi:hypothetical protein